MGRKTYLSIGKPLPKRTNIVISRDQGFAPPGVLVARSLEAALAAARDDAARRGVDEIAVIGGVDIFLQTMTLADRLEITHVHARPPGDTYFRRSIKRAGAWLRAASIRPARMTMPRSVVSLPTGLIPICTGKVSPHSTLNRDRGARCKLRTAPQSLPRPNRARRGSPRRVFHAMEQSGRRPWGSGGGKGPLGLRAAIVGADATVLRNCCGAARTSCGACCRAAISAAAALR